jgi:hypothetical protein
VSLPGRPNSAELALVSGMFMTTLSMAISHRPPSYAPTSRGGHRVGQSLEQHSQRPGAQPLPGLGRHSSSAYLLRPGRDDASYTVMCFAPERKIRHRGRSTRLLAAMRYGYRPIAAQLVILSAHYAEYRRVS